MKKLKEVAKELGLKPIQAYRVMVRVCDLEQCRKEKGGWELAEDQAERIRAEVKGFGEAESRFVDVQVLRKCPNPRFVEGFIYGEPGKVSVGIPRNMRAEFMVGKFIRAEVIEQSDGRKFYRHEKLARYGTLNK